MTKEKTTPEAGIIDLASLDTATASDADAKVPILHPTSKEPIGINIKVLGKHSTIFRELVRERINNRIKMESQAAKRGKTVDPRTAEQVEQEALEMLVACTMDWETEIKNEKGEIVETKPTVFFEGQHLPFSAQNALLVYSRMLWMREQVDNAIGDLENFIPA
jgi:hypothetical protein